MSCDALVQEFLFLLLNIDGLYSEDVQLVSDKPASVGIMHRLGEENPHWQTRNVFQTVGNTFLVCQCGVSSPC